VLPSVGYLTNIDRFLSNNYNSMELKEMHDKDLIRWEKKQKDVQMAQGLGLIWIPIVSR
jgi:hypothetical protein